MAYLTDRRLTAEWMDQPGVSEAELRQSLAFIRFVNRRLRGVEAVLGHLRKWSRRWPAGRTIRVLDLATGSGDIPLALARWADRAGHDLRVVGLDMHPVTLRLAQEHLRGHPRIRLLRADALSPPFAPNSFDYVVSSMFLHHLPDIEVLTVLRIMDRLARRGIVWNDLLRHRRAWLWAKLLTVGWAPIVRHDAPASVAAGFTRREVLALRDRLSLNHLRYHRCFGHRFTLAGQR